MNSENNYNPADYKFKTLGEFKIYINSGANVAFEFHNRYYGMERIDDEFHLWDYELKDDIVQIKNLEDILNFCIDGVKIRDLILEAEIGERLW